MSSCPHEYEHLADGYCMDCWVERAEQAESERDELKAFLNWLEDEENIHIKSFFEFWRAQQEASDENT